MTLIISIVRALRDLRQDLFRHMETRPSSFFDKVPIGRIMTRVTNDVEALYEMLRGMGSLVGEFMPFFVALTIMLGTSVRLTLILLLLVPIVAAVTVVFHPAAIPWTTCGSCTSTASAESPLTETSDSQRCSRSS